MPARLRPAFLALLMLGGLAMATEGQPLPDFSGRDLRGRVHHGSEYSGSPALLVVTTDRDGADGTRRWFNDADEKMPKSVRRVSIISIELPFYATWGRVRDRAARQVPIQYWSDTLLDRDGKMAKSLRLEPSRTPYVFALDSQGRVLAEVHAEAGSPLAQEVWSALKASR